MEDDLVAMTASRVVSSCSAVETGVLELEPFRSSIPFGESSHERLGAA
jgi:hypothetical protein